MLLKNNSLRRNRRGAMLVLVAFMLIVVLIMAAFSIDIAYMQLTRTQLRVASDAAARSAASALTSTGKTDEARKAARKAAEENLVAGKGLELNDSDIIFGRTIMNDDREFAFQANGEPYNAVRILARRTADSDSGEVPLFLGSMLGRGTFAPHVHSTAASNTRDISLVLDRSGSMGSENKIDDLKSAVAVFLTELEKSTGDERVSLSSYATTASKDVNMTSDLSAVQAAVNKYEANGFTAIGQGVLLGTESLLFDALARPSSDKMMVLMTDGRENREPNVGTLLPVLLSRNQTVYTISFGSGANQKTMQEIAEATGGRHYHAPNGKKLIEIFQSIGRNAGVVLVD